MTEQEFNRRRAFIRLGFTEEEIKEVEEADRRIDKGEKLFELTDEQKQASRKARQTTGDKTQYKPKVREKIVNNDKIFLMKAFADAVEDKTDFEILNAEREIVFKYNGVKYKVTLSCPRT